MEKNDSATEYGVLARPGKYLTFLLGEEVYGIEIQRIQEIIGMMKVTHVPRTPACVRGVINLRGKVIPVADLRLRFELDTRPDTERTCIIVLEIKDAAGRAIVGIIVDEVSEVVFIDGDQIEPPPALGAGVDTEFILGMGKVGEKVVMLLGVDKVLSVGEMAVLEP